MFIFRKSPTIPIFPKENQENRNTLLIIIIGSRGSANFVLLFLLNKVVTTRCRNNANSEIQKFIEKRDCRRHDKIGSVPTRSHGMVRLSLIEQYVPLPIVSSSRSGSRCWKHDYKMVSYREHFLVSYVQHSFLQLSNFKELFYLIWSLWCIKFSLLFFVKEIAAGDYNIFFVKNSCIH